MNSKPQFNRPAGAFLWQSSPNKPFSDILNPISRQRASIAGDSGSPDPFPTAWRLRGCLPGGPLPWDAFRPARDSTGRFTRACILPQIGLESPPGK